MQNLLKPFYVNVVALLMFFFCMISCTKNNSLPAATIQSLECDAVRVTPVLVSEAITDNIVVIVPYTGGNGGYFYYNTFYSTNMYPLRLELQSGNLQNGNGELQFKLVGTTTKTDSIATFNINVLGKTCMLNLPIKKRGLRCKINGNWLEVNFAQRAQTTVNTSFAFYDVDISASDTVGNYKYINFFLEGYVLPFLQGVIEVGGNQLVTHRGSLALGDGTSDFITTRINYEPQILLNIAASDNKHLCGTFSGKLRGYYDTSIIGKVTDGEFYVDVWK